MEGNGPIQGTPKELRRDCGRAACCQRWMPPVRRIMGIDPNKVVYLNAPDRAHYNDESTITQTGETPRAVRTDFKLNKDFAEIRLA